MENSHLCWKCRALVNSPETEDIIHKPLNSSRFDPSVQSRTLKTKEHLKETARKGCLLCQRLMHYMDEDMRKALHNIEHDDVVFTHSLHLSEGKPGFWSFHVKSEKITKDLGSNEIKCFIDLYPKNEVDDFLNHTEISSSTATPLTLSLVENWIDKCNHLHKRCPSARNRADFVPDRVIDINPGRCPRLLVGGKPAEVPQFTSLSHCWGSSMPLKLLSSNIEAHQKGISYSSLSKTYQDAVTISRRLGINYIWIDSLCIVQDSELDWQEQSAKMSLIYTHAYCNIAAVHASDGSGGCFANRESSLIRPLKVNLHWGCSPGPYYAIQSSYQRDNISTAPLNMRAWVFQERTLARRNLFFCETEVFFQCHELVASESFPRQLPPQIRMSLGGIYPQREGPRLRKWRNLEPDTSLYAYSMWDWLVQDFSSGRLTYATDKLVAISAVAVEMQKHIRSEYFAGLWRQHLPYQLLWEVRSIQWICPRSRPTEYIAPSWSWASTNGSVEQACGVRFPDERDIILEVMDAKIDLVTDVNPFGQAKGGYVTVKGYLASGTFRLSGSPFSSRQDILLQFGLISQPFVIIDDEDDMREFAGKEVFFLPIQYCPDRNTQGYDGRVVLPEITGIILRQLSQSKKEYARIGKFSVTSAKSFLSAYRPSATDAVEVGLGGKEWGKTEVLTIL